MFGDIYEKILKDLQSAGNAGEFYTPRAVTQFIVEQVDPQPRRNHPRPRLRHRRLPRLRHRAPAQAERRPRTTKTTLQDCFPGIEKKHLPHVLCMTNLLLHGIDVPSNVRHDNTLARPLRDWGPKERVDVIVTNPPFGGMEEDGIEANFPAEFRTRETADLFLVLLMTLLKPGGRAGLVLPDGTLFGEGVKTRIKRSSSPSATSTRSSACPTASSIPTPASAPTSSSSPRARPPTTSGTTSTRTRRARRATPRPNRSASRSSSPRRRGGAKRKENEQAWKVSIEDIKARGYNLDIKNPNGTDEGAG